MNNTAKTASAISNADDRNSAKAPDGPCWKAARRCPGRRRCRRWGSQRAVCAAPAVAAAVRRRLPARRRWCRRCCCRRPAAWWPGAAGSRCWTDGPRCCRRQRGAPRRSNEAVTSAAPETAISAAAKTAKDRIWSWLVCSSYSRGRRPVAPHPRIFHNNLNCIRITDKIPPHKFPVGKVVRKRRVSPAAHPRAARRCRRSD